MTRAADELLPVVSCKIDVFGADEAAAHAALLTCVAQAITAPEELAEGYRYALAPSAFAHAAAWIALERRCCSFFSFDLRWEAGAVSPSLEVTGPPGAAAILATFGA